MATPWTLERRLRQAELIRQWQPWKQSTGPRTTQGKAASSRNAWQGGHRAQLRELAQVLNAELAEMRRLNDLALIRHGQDSAAHRKFAAQDGQALRKHSA